MSVIPEPMKPLADSHREETECEREAVAADAGEIGDDDRDPVNGEGGALGLGEDESLTHNRGD